MRSVFQDSRDQIAGVDLGLIDIDLRRCLETSQSQKRPVAIAGHQRQNDACAQAKRRQLSITATFTDYIKTKGESRLST